MVKRCIVCNEAEAKYMIKDTSDYYCKECALENFSDLQLLITVEEVAQQLKEFLKKKTERLEKEEQESKEKSSEKDLNEQDNQDREN
ncbi:MAG: hypothetical protein KKA62_02355 [Nanoarchaeota archaeon]|nr:hypothetical protein [Nanoarchaeota archaeon]MBU1643676.1 hypothetical protein [Nanoarchaeota archaeon]MBU1976774.1 hypothetical protein [Nanoarchaeota archaeon]